MKAVLSSIIATLILVSSGAKAEVLIDMKTFLKEELGTSAKLAKEGFTLTAEQKAAAAKLGDSGDTAFTFFYGKTAEGTLEKACTVLPQKGKEGPMNVGVCFAPNGIVKSVRVLDHEEERGKGITEKAFLTQFQGKKVSDAFTVGKDVDGISGATWSSKAVSEAVRRASYGFKTLVQK
jgi:Na+-translocating ferredoxin:NAD+ oxidoreductase RnfG subunit